MRRRLPNLAVALSLVLCVVVLGLWVRSYFALDHVAFYGTGGGMVLQSRGQVGAGVYRAGARPKAPRPTGWAFGSEPAEPLGQVVAGPFAFSRFGFAGQSVNDPRAGIRGLLLIVPHWFLAVLLAVAPAGKLARHRLGRASRRAAAGLCPSCGYDLRASPERCPECGAAAVSIAG